jgi:hypothetical protein
VGREADIFQFGKVGGDTGEREVTVDHSVHGTAKDLQGILSEAERVLFVLEVDR